MIMGNGWRPIESAPENVIVDTKIDDEHGARNHQPLVRRSGLWWVADNGPAMYVHYQPTHWRPRPTVPPEGTPPEGMGDMERVVWFVSVLAGVYQVRIAPHEVVRVTEAVKRLIESAREDKR